MGPISPALLEILACPRCRKPVTPKEEMIVCTNNSSGLRYPIREGITVMLVEEAEPETDSGIRTPKPEE